MSFIKTVRKNGNAYYYRVKSVREGSNVRHEILEYYGTQNPTELKKMKKIEQMPFAKISINNIYSAGPFLCLCKLISEYGVCNHIDETIKKRQGLSAGFALFTVALHKLFGFDPSQNNLDTWLEDTPIKINERIKTSDFSCDNINYIFDKLFSKHGAVEELENIQAELFHLAKKRFKINEKNLYYDITSTYFEGERCDDAEYGYSRDHRKDKKQINIGLLATKDKKFPTFTKVFKGNISDKSTVVEIVTMMKYIYKFKDVIAIMDRGMTSEINIMVLDVNEYGYILGASSTAKVVKNMILKTSKRKIMKNGNLFRTKKGIAVYALSMTKTIYRKRRRVIIMYNESMARDQIEDVEQKIEIAEEEYKQHLRSMDKKKAQVIEEMSKPFVKITKKNRKWAFERDKDAISHVKKKAGKSVLITTVEEPADEVLGEYFAKDIIEKIFRFSKQYSNLRPVRRRRSQRVKVDVFLSFLGYYIIAFIREILSEKGIKVTDEQLIAELPKIRLAVKQDMKKKQIAYEIVGNSPLQKKIVDALELDKSIEDIKKL